MAGPKRFLHIEHRRPERPETAEETHRTPGRWESPAMPASTTERVEDPSTQVQPFVRCAVCQLDQHRFSSVCAQCQAPLDSPQQQAFNADLWARIQAERAASQPEDAIPRQTLSVAQEQWVEQQLRRDLESSWLLRLGVRLEAIDDRLFGRRSPIIRRRAYNAILALSGLLLLAGIFVHAPFWLRLSLLVLGVSIGYVFGPSWLRHRTPEDS